MKTKIIVLIAFSLSIFSLRSQNESDKGEFSFSGYSDVNYFQNLNHPLSGSNTGTSGFARAFDQREGQFQLGLVQTKMSYAYKRSTLVTDLVFGPHADLGNFGNVVGPLGSTTALAIKQAYLTFLLGDKLNFTLGQFGTHIGYEVIDAPLNFNYSLSNCFNNGPFYHIGLKAEYAFSSKVNLMAGLVNNWDNLYDNNSFKTAVSQLRIMPNENLVMYFNYIGGNESTQNAFNREDSLHSFKQMFDVVVNYQLSPKLYVGLNGVVGALNNNDTTMNWGGVALYANYTFCDAFALGLRAEYFDNTQGVQYIGNTQVQSFTLTGKCTLIKDHLYLKPEVRYDIFGNHQFEDRDGAFTKKSQITVGAAAVYKF